MRMCERFFDEVFIVKFSMGLDLFIDMKWCLNMCVNGIVSFWYRLFMEFVKF